MKRILIAVLVIGTTALYVLREFHPEQPAHHEFNSAAGVALLATILAWIFFPDKDGDS